MLNITPLEPEAGLPEAAARLEAKVAGAAQFQPSTDKSIEPSNAPVLLALTTTVEAETSQYKHKVVSLIETKES
jgi:hypothetical protein